MYIQRQPDFGRDREPLQIPENYSGTTVTPGGVPTEKEERAELPAGQAFLPETAKREEKTEKPSAPAGCEPREEKPHGLPWHALTSRFPFLSSLLPPKKAETERQTSDLALIVGVLLLLSGEQDDILPILLILLLA